MSSRREDRGKTNQNLSVISKCVAVVLSPVENTTTKKDPSENQSEVLNGKEILEDFKLRNKTCYWNPALMESISSLQYFGFVEPCTLLVGGKDLHLQNLRMAWGRRVLNDPAGYRIRRIGDVNGIEMQVIPQTQFIPLPEILCLVILELNNQRVVATLDTIQERLLKCYSETETPNVQVLYDTLGSLIRERKVFHTGSGYFVVTPDTYRLPTDNPGAQQFPLSWLHYNPMYIPVLDEPKPPCRSISCQVSIAGQQQNSCPQQEVKKSPPDTEPVAMPTAPPCNKARLSRSLSARRATKEKSGGAEEPTFKRSSSVKHRGDNKSKPSNNDVNLTKSNINKAKDKGEKKSLLSKLFGRNKKKSSASTESSSEQTGPSKVPQKEVEYATFSGQFPPPEWQWYENKVEKFHRTQDWICDQLSQYTEMPQDLKVNDVARNKCPSRNNKENKMENKNERHRKPLVEQRCHSHRKRDSLRHGNSAHRNSIDKALREKVESSGPRDYVNIDVARNYLDQLGEMEQHHPPINPYHVPKQKSPEEVYGHFTSHNNVVDQCHVDNSHHNDVVHHSHRQKKNVNHYSIPPYNIPPGNDISFEYQGRLPKKNSAYAVSRDSGVNCVGLKQQKKETKHTYVRRHHRHSVHESVPSVRHEDKQHRTEKHEKHHHQQHHHHHHHHPQRIQNNLNSNRVVNGANINSDKNEIVCVAEINHCNPLQSCDIEDNRNSKLRANNGEYIGGDIEGTESLEERSEQSYDTVIDSRQIINSPVDNVMQQTEELVLGDSGFSSPRNFDNSLSVDITPGILRNDNVDCPNLASSHKCSKNYYQKSDNSSQSSGNCDRKMVELSSSYDDGKILNNLKHVYKENTVAEHLNNVNNTHECHKIDEDNVKLMQQLPKKFDFDDSDYRVVGIV